MAASKKRCQLLIQEMSSQSWPNIKREEKNEKNERLAALQANLKEIQEYSYQK